MRARIAVLLALAGGLLAAMAPAGVAAAGTVQPAGGGLVAGAGVLTRTSWASGPGGGTTGATTQATPPSFCYVSVFPPQISFMVLTATWRVDCRSGANSNRPATDIASIGMDVRIYQGDPDFVEPGTNIAARRCTTGISPIMDCSASAPIQYGPSYYTKLDVTVTLTGGGSFSGSFYTTAIRLV